MKSKLLPLFSASAFLSVFISASSAMAQIGWPPPTNPAPAVFIVSPHEGAMFLVGDNVHICAESLYFTDQVAKVEFFAGNTSLGVATNSASLWDDDFGNVFCLTSSNLTAGAYTLKAVATDVGGLSVTSAVVDISVVTNLPPRVHITKPANGAVILGPTNVMVCASAYDPDGSVVSVQFFVGTNSLGVVPTPPVIYVTNDDGIFPIKQPYCLIWTNKSVGAFTLTAVATDNGGLTATSAPVHVTVVSDLPPKVRIETPYYGAMFRQPVNIKICAQAYDPDGTVTNVEFFAGTNDLGSVTTPILVTNWWGDEVQSLYCLTWSNAPVGSYRLKAVATDNAGMSSSSALVPIVIYPPPSPTVKITTPRNFSTIYNAPANINVCALERYFTNPIVNVSFFAGTNSIGSTTNAPYSCIVWSNAPAGAYNLTAKATDSHGTTVSSSAVSIKVVTNAPPVYMDW